MKDIIIVIEIVNFTNFVNYSINSTKIVMKFIISWKEFKGNLENYFKYCYVILLLKIRIIKLCLKLYRLEILVALW